ncbi:MAG: NAD-binding protein [Nitriliruptorales bacterium]|nr:NAD-binding protein [Nitriliruptorales bacterium]
MAVDGSETVQSLGVIGWGRMGSTMGTWLVRRGWPVAAFDVAAGSRDAIAVAGAQPMDSAATLAAASDLVLVVVVDDYQVEDVLTGSGTVLEAARPGTIIAICASTKPSTCQRLAAKAAKRDVQVVDVALVGGERGAEQGALQLMCGGPAAAIDACAEAFAAFATDVCHVGDVGAGQVAKTLNNLLLWACLRADYEALTLAKRWGIQPGRIRAFLNVGTGANRPLADWSKQRLRFPKKDLEVGLATASEIGVEMPLIEALAPLVADMTQDDLIELR